MSHSSTPSATPSTGGPSPVVPPPTSAPGGGGAHPSPLSAYSVVPPPSLIAHPLAAHPHLAPPPHAIYHPQFTADMLWKSSAAAAAAAGGQRYGGIPTHILTAAAAAQSAEDMMGRGERVAMVMQDRDRHERIMRYEHYKNYNILTVTYKDK